jgi:hypothetical protein
MVVTIDTPAGALRAVGNPIKIAGATTAYAPPPLLGEHDPGDVWGPAAAGRPIPESETTRTEGSAS